MSRTIAPEEWRPIGVPSLEPAALESVTTEKNSYIIAGPGAGKTEVLAQRASFLLLTGKCPKPKNILAISFKRDAARNLESRVFSRCGEELARRLHSYTFDAFSKGLLDRFREGLPQNWRPWPDYIVRQENYTEIKQFLQTASPPVQLGTKLDLGQYEPKKFHDAAFVGRPLKPNGFASDKLYWWAAGLLWYHRLHVVAGSELTFPMIGRLAELILRINASVRDSLRMTYSHVLLDEFQDTTVVQYEFLRTAFAGSMAVLTAVGDHRQRIMGWAMALKDAFTPFAQDFSAKEIKLQMNYRAAPELVRIQQYLMKSIDPDSAPVMGIETEGAEKGSCVIWKFQNETGEAQTLVDHCKKLLTSGVAPREIAILVRGRVPEYTRALVREFADRKIDARMENELQDLLAEPLIERTVGVIKLAMEIRDPVLWDEILSFSQEIEGTDTSSYRALGSEGRLEKMLSGLRKDFGKVDSQESVAKLLSRITSYFGPERLKLLYPQYRQGKRYSELLDALCIQLWNYYQKSGNWSSAISGLLGESAIPIMTIHKSKGLEYHTVVFLGLEDSAFWKFTEESAEDTCSFFVAFSRAKNNVIFTFSKTRSVSERYPAQSRNKIKPLYDLLHDAGVKEVSFG